MTVHVHALTGCSPTPLGHYLKGLGVLRLVAEQKDAQARGWWKADTFHLATALDHDALLRFFLEEYAPTPLVAPWNGGTGFYPKDNKRGIDGLRNSVAPRLAPYRAAVEAAAAMAAGRNESPKDEAKSALLRAARQRWRGPLLEWLDAAVVLDADGEPAYPALFGTGGNDGRLDFTNNFMQRLVDLLDTAHPLAPAREKARDLLRASLFSEPEPGLPWGPPGQFLPGITGGANGSTGFFGSAPLNPWDYVLMLEGALVFISGVSRQSRVQALPQAAAPFAVRASAAGSGTTAATDKTRGEQWMPIWEAPATLVELRGMIAEGRSQLGRRASAGPLEFGRAIARLGVARGITAFERYGFIERNGQANLAVPLGRWPVRAQPHQDLLDEVAGWVERLGRAGDAKGAPASVARAARACEEAMLACCRDGNDPRRWQTLLVALGAAEAGLATSPRFTAEKRLRPLPRLSARWLAAANDGRAELRLALALAGQHGPSPQDHAPDLVDPVRRHFLPLDRTGERFEIQEDALAAPADLVCKGGSLEAVAIALVGRRIMEAGRRGLPHLPLVPVPGTEARVADIAAFLAGDVDDAAVLGLARPLMALDWRRFALPPGWRRAPAGEAGEVALYGIFRLALWPGPVTVPGSPDAPATGAVDVGLDPAVFTRLATGDVQRAAVAAYRRLSAAGLRPHVRAAVGSAALARRLAAALAFALHAGDAAALVERLTRPALKDDDPQHDDPSITREEKATP